MQEAIKELFEESSLRDIQDFLTFEKEIKDLQWRIEDLNITNKGEFFSHFTNIINAYKLYYLYPNLVSKKTMGVLAVSPKGKSDFYKNILDFFSPSFRLHCNKMISCENQQNEILNYLDKKVAINSGVGDLINSKIDVENIIDVISEYQPTLKYKNLSFLDASDSYLEDKISMLDGVIVLCESMKFIKSTIKKLSSENSYHTIFIVKNDKLKTEELTELYNRNLNVRIIEKISDLDKILEQMNTPIDKIKNLKICAKIVLEDILIAINKKKKQYTSKRNDIEKLLAFEANEDLNTLSDNLRQSINNLTESNRKLNRIKIDVNNIFSSLSENNNPAENELLFILAKKYITNDNMSEAQHLHHELVRNKYYKASFLEYLLTGKSNVTLLSYLTHVRDLDINMEVVKHFKNEYKILESIISISSIKNLKDPEIYNKIGDYYFHIDKVNEAETAYKTAVNLGCPKSGKSLYNLYQHHNLLDDKRVKFLSNNMVAEACLEMGLRDLKADQLGLASVEFKKGAILGSDKCLYQLGLMHLKNRKLAYFFFNQIKNRTKYWNDTVLDFIATFHYYGNNVEALERFYDETKYLYACYYLGKLFEKRGNKQKALKCYKQARSLPQGAQDYSRLNSEQQTRSHKTYESRTVSRHTESSGCFIITAVCKNLNKKRETFRTILKFKNFRDTWLIDQPHGISDLDQYYAIAPKIVAEIDKQPNSQEIYSNLWINHVEPCLTLLQENKPQQVRETYEKMVRTLLSQHHLKPPLNQ